MKEEEVAMNHYGGKATAESTGSAPVPVIWSSMPPPRPEVRGIDLDAQTRCAHYGTVLDIIAIKMKCCGVYYACKECHEALADHPIEVWPQAEWNQPAVLCGACGRELSIARYMSSGNQCPDCGAAFNPGCRNHYQFYFESAI
jgi:uncharacterized CHY-type Zn-finger protein